jgi:hypothetical protein
MKLNEPLQPDIEQVAEQLERSYKPQLRVLTSRTNSERWRGRGGAVSVNG